MIYEFRTLTCEGRAMKALLGCTSSGRMLGHMLIRQVIRYVGVLKERNYICICGMSEDQCTT